MLMINSHSGDIHPLIIFNMSKLGLIILISFLGCFYVIDKNDTKKT